MSSINQLVFQNSNKGFSYLWDNLFSDRERINVLNLESESIIADIVNTTHIPEYGVKYIVRNILANTNKFITFRDVNAFCLLISGEYRNRANFVSRVDSHDFHPPVQQHPLR